jgi:hypothetical protein
VTAFDRDKIRERGPLDNPVCVVFYIIESDDLTEIFVFVHDCLSQIFGADFNAVLYLGNF